MTPPKNTVAKFLAAQIAASELSQKQIANAVGYANPNVITMFKQGTTKLPLNMVGPIAKALNADPVYLLRLVMEEYLPDTWADLQKIVGTSLVSERELRLIRLVRANACGHELNLDTSDARDTLSRTVKQLVEEQIQ